MIITNKILLVRTQPVFILVLSLAISAHVYLSLVGLVEISVGNAPGIGSLRFNNLTYNVHIPENSRSGTRITIVTARFISGRSGSISYSFASGNEDHTFSINSVTGED